MEIVLTPEEIPDFEKWYKKQLEEEHQGNRDHEVWANLTSALRQWRNESKSDRERKYKCAMTILLNGLYATIYYLEKEYEEKEVQEYEVPM